MAKKVSTAAKRGEAEEELNESPVKYRETVQQSMESGKVTNDVGSEKFSTQSPEYSDYIDRMNRRGRYSIEAHAHALPEGVGEQLKQEIARRQHHVQIAIPQPTIEPSPFLRFTDVHGTWYEWTRAKIMGCEVPPAHPGLPRWVYIRLDAQTVKRIEISEETALALTSPLFIIGAPEQGEAREKP